MIDPFIYLCFFFVLWISFTLSIAIISLGFLLAILYAGGTTALPDVGKCTFMEYFCDAMKCQMVFVKTLQKDPNGDCRRLHCRLSFSYTWETDLCNKGYWGSELCSRALWDGIVLDTVGDQNTYTSPIYKVNGRWNAVPALITYKCLPLILDTMMH